MTHLQYMPGDPRLVDQLVYELKSKGIFDQFRKDCIADVDTRPAYQNLRQRVENSVSSFLSRQCWKPDLNKNQLREKLRKHILDGNYLEQGVERIVDQVVNPKVASVFIPQVEDLVYNYLGISRKKSVTAETSNGKIGTDDLLPTDLEAVSPGSVKSNDDKEAMDENMAEENKMEVEETKDEDKTSAPEVEKDKAEDASQLPNIMELTNDSDMVIENTLTSLHEDIKLENIPPPDNSPPKADNDKIQLEKIELPKEPIIHISAEIPPPSEIPLPKDDKEQFFKPIGAPSDDDSSSDSSLRRNMSPLTPIRNYNNENSCDAQQAFENDSDSKSNDKKEPSSFRFAIEAKSPENNLEEKLEKKDSEQVALAYQFNNQVNINTFNTPMYDDSSNSNNLQIDYESDANSKTNTEKLPEVDQTSQDKRDKKNDDRKSSHNKSSHRSRDSHRHSSSKDKRSNSKQSTSRDSSRHDKKPKDDHSKSKSSHKEREKSKDRGDKKDSRDSSKHRSSSHKSSSSHRDSKSHRSSSSSQRHSSDKRSSDDKKSSSSHKDKSEKNSEKSSDRSSRDKRDSKSSSHRSEKDRKSSSKSKHDDKDKKKDKKETDDHYSLSGRGNHGRRSTDRDSNDGSSSNKGSQNQSASKPTENKKETKESSSKSDNTSTTSGESTSPSDRDHVVSTASDTKNSHKPIRVENHLEVPILSPPRLPFVPDVTLKKPKFAANLEEAKRMMKMRKFLDEEQKRMNQEAALLLEFQANVRPSLSQVYSSIPGPELEFACINNEVNSKVEKEISEPKKVVEETVTVESVPTEQANEVKEIEKSESIDSEVKTETKMDIKNELEESPAKDTEMIEETDNISTVDKNETYNENKPFSQLMEEISEYSKASEKNKKDNVLDNLVDDDNKKRTEFFEVTIITEELSETDEPAVETEPLPDETEITSIPETPKSPELLLSPKSSENEEETLRYFAEHEKFDAEIKRHQYSDFLKSYTERNLVTNRIHVINCDTYEENILKEVCATLGTFEVINYYKNGHLKLPNTAKNVIKYFNLTSEVSLPVDSYDSKSPSPVYSPVKSECSFELSSDYDAKLEEMVNRTSRQEVMEIILGSVIADDIPTIDYCMESSIDSGLHVKRKLAEVESTENNNRHVLTKMRKLSDSDQISSTTEESEEISNNNRVSNPPRSKYLGRAKRVGLPRPRRNNLPNSPSSDKSVENYEQNTQATPQTPNGKFKSATRNKVQRYDTSDLYKPKLHYLSRRNNIS